MNKVQVSSGRADAIADIAKVEDKYKAKWVGQFPLKTRDDGWSESPADVYYQTEPPIKGYSNYFGLLYQQGSLYIVDASIISIKKFVAIAADDGEIIYSRYRHDYRTSSDKSVFIDGGFDYTRSTYGISTLTLSVVDGEFYSE